MRNYVTKHVPELKLTKFFAVIKPECANYEGVSRRIKKGTLTVHLTVTLRAISLIGPKKCDGDLSLLLELKDDLSHFCDTTVPQKCDSVT